MNMRQLARLGVLALLLVAVSCQAPGARPSQPPNPGGGQTSGSAGAARAPANGEASTSGGASMRGGGTSGGSAVAPAAATLAPVALRYAYSATSIVFLAQKLAQEQGIYRQHGLDMEQILMGAGVMAAAQLSGE